MGAITLDGKSLEFTNGQSVIEVAAAAGTEIPHYCWHPRLSIAANCRMCLVEVDGSPKLAPACQTPCKDGMKVDTRNDKVKGAQRAVHEFLLINHPIDCPICDQAGECKLQDYYMRFQLQGSRMHEPKVHKPRLEQLGPHVMYNAERCIVCTRCVRFMEEVAQDRQLGVFNRGDHCEIGVMPGAQLDSAYSLNTVDVCPVGALTSTAFRFKQRVWNLKRSESLCGGCAKGCNTWIDQRSAQVYRMLPRDNDAVNASWMCDEGRLTYARANDGRLTEPWVRQPGPEGRAPALATESEVAIKYAAELLAPWSRGPDSAAPGTLRAVLSLHATLEEGFVLGRLLKDRLGLRRVTLVGHADGEGDALLRVPDKNPNRAGLTRLFAGLGITVDDEASLTRDLRAGAIAGLLWVGHEADGLSELAALTERVHPFVHVAAAASPLSGAADVTLPCTTWVQTDGTWVNHAGRAQRLHPAYGAQGQQRARHAWLLALSERLGGGKPRSGEISLPSEQTVRAEIESQVPGFAHALTTLDAQGRPLDGAQTAAAGAAP